jgi:hypothetical protein
MPTAGASTWRGRSQRCGAIVLVAVVCAGVVGLVGRSNLSTSSDVVVHLDPLTIRSLFDPPGAVHDPEEDAEAEARQAAGAEVDAAVAAETSRPATITAAVADVEAQTIRLSVDAGSPAASQVAAAAAGEAYLDLRAEGGLAQAEGGLDAVAASLERLQSERAGAVDADQLDVIDQEIFDNEASRGQLQEAITRLEGAQNGSVGQPTDPSRPRHYLLPAFGTFWLVLLVGAFVSWLHRRWVGPVRRRAGLVGGPPVTVLDEAQLPSYALGLRLRNESGRAGVLVVLGAASSQDAAGFASRLAGAVAGANSVVLVGARQPSELDLADLADFAHGEPLPQVPQGEPLVVGFGAVGADPSGAIATRATAAALELLGAAADLVVVAGPVATAPAAAAWSAHSKHLVLVVVEGRTRQGEVRQGLEALARFGVTDVRVLLVAPSLAAPRRAAPPATPVGA